MIDIIVENTHAKKIKGGCRDRFFAIKIIPFGANPPTTNNKNSLKMTNFTLELLVLKL